MGNILNLVKADAAKIMSASIIYKVLPLIAVVVAFFLPQSVTFLLVLAVYLLGYGLISYDENYRTQNYYAFLPIRRSEYVLGKYIFSFLISLAFMAVCFLSSALGQMMEITVNEMPWEQVFSLYALGFIITFVYLAVQYPLALFLGGVKGRIAAMIFYLVIFSFVFNSDSVMGVLMFIQNSSLFLLVVIALALYAISCVISVNIYEKRDVH